MNNFTTLKLGSFYRRRDGVETRITRHHPNLNYPWEAETGDRYGNDGGYCLSGYHPKDLVEENIYVKLGPTPAPANLVAAPIPTPVVQATPLSSRANRHAAIIKAWADGAEVQYKGPRMTDWADMLPAGSSMTNWREDVEYRLKPQLPTFLVGLKMNSATTDSAALTGSRESLDEFRTHFRPGFIRKIYKITIDPVTKDAISIESLPCPIV